MSEAPTNLPEPRPRTNREYEDPYYHDEEPDVQSDDRPRAGRPPTKKKPPRTPPPPRRHYED